MPSPAELRNGGIEADIASSTRWRMNHAVFRLTPHFSRTSRSVQRSTWHSA